MQKNSNEKHFLYALLAIVSVLTVAIFWPFLTILVLAMAFAVVLNPINNWLNKHITRNITWLSSLITVTVFLVVLCVPIFFVGKSVFVQTQNLYYGVIDSGQTANGLIEKIDISINKIIPEGMSFDTHEKIATVAGNLSSNLASLFASTFKTILMLFLMLLTVFFLLKNGSYWKKSLFSLLPLSDANINEISNNMRDSINRIFKGSFLIAIVQGLLMGIGLTIFGVPNAAIWAVVAGMASFIPTIGTSIVSVPAIIFLYISGMELQALGMLIWSMVAVGTIDNILSPYIISKNTEISSLFILLSILGGITLMGPIGLFIGPLIISLLFSLVTIYKRENSF
jgi:predicted PurR-regulated permease PerM